jgi:hypothetical protein
VIAILIIFIILFVAISISFYHRQKNRLPSYKEDRLIPPYNLSGYTSLFTDQEMEALPKSKPAKAINKSIYITRALKGDVSVLKDVSKEGDWNFYRDVLDKLIEVNQKNGGDLNRLTTYILENNELRSSRRLAEILIEQWKQSPSKDRLSTMLHLVALSDDTSIFEVAVNTVVESWYNGELPQVTNESLLSLIESEYWVINQAVRHAGSSFLLKRRLIHLRRQLKAATPTT